MVDILLEFNATASIAHDTKNGLGGARRETVLISIV